MCCLMSFAVLSRNQSLLPSRQGQVQAMLARGCWKPEERLSPPLHSTSRRPGQLFCHFQHPSMSSGAGAGPAPGSSALWTWHTRLSLVGRCSAGTHHNLPRYYATFRCIIYPFGTTPGTGSIASIVHGYDRLFHSISKHSTQQSRCIVRGHWPTATSTDGKSDEGSFVMPQADSLPCRS